MLEAFLSQQKTDRTDLLTGYAMLQDILQGQPAPPVDPPDVEA
jgi:hypothetical protein